MTEHQTLDNATGSPPTVYGWDYISFNLTASTPERYLMASWCILTSLACLAGNILVLVASLKFKMVKLVGLY